MGQSAVNNLLGEQCGFANHDSVKNDNKKKKQEEDDNNNELSASKVNNKNSDLIFTQSSDQSPSGKPTIEDFRLVKLLGTGAFGKVFLVERKSCKKLFAMKILRKDIIKKRKQKVHTITERKLLESLDHPFIVSLHYAFQTKDKLYMVLDFCQGGELFFHMRKEKRFSERKTKFYAAEILLALEYLHSKDIIYRDLKPENILLDLDGHLKITDFGLSKEDIGYNQQAFTFCGSPHYLSPEIIKGGGHGKAVDWWTLGILIYEMLAGNTPFNNRDRYQMFENIVNKPILMKEYFSMEAKSLLEGLLKIKPEERLGSQGGAEEIKQHDFFKEVKWEKLIEKKYDPPFKPTIDNKVDTKHFDKEFTTQDAVDSPVNQKLFKDDYIDFTYEKKNEEKHIQQLKQSNPPGEQQDQSQVNKYLNYNLVRISEAVFHENCTKSDDCPECERLAKKERKKQKLNKNYINHQDLIEEYDSDQLGLTEDQKKEYQEEC